MTLTISCIRHTIIPSKHQALRTLTTGGRIVALITAQKAFLLAHKPIVVFLQLVSIPTNSTFSSITFFTASGTPNTSIVKELESVLTAQTLSNVLRITGTTAASQTLNTFPIVS